LPNWGVDDAPSMNIAHIRLHVNAKDDELHVKKNELKTLIAEFDDLDSRSRANNSEASKLQDNAKAMTKMTLEGRVVEDQRKEDIKKAIDDADIELKEVNGLRRTIQHLIGTQENNAHDLNTVIDQKRGALTSLQTHVESILLELKSVKDRTKEAESLRETKRAEFTKELSDANHTKKIIESAFKRAQASAEDFIDQPDYELLAEMKQLAVDEDAIINDTDEERKNIVASKFIF